MKTKQTMNTKQIWYAARTGNHQGLIVAEGTGDNIAVAYDKDNAPLLAAAPELLEALKACQVQLAEYVEWHQKRGGCSIEIESAEEQARQAIQKAEGL